MEENKNAYRLLVGKLEGKRPLGRPRCKWVDNIKTDLVEMEWGGVDWIDVAQDRDKCRELVNAETHLRVPKRPGKLSNGYITGGLSSGAQVHGHSQNRGRHGSSHSRYECRKDCDFLTTEDRLKDEEHEEWCLLGCYAVWLL
jgi:hypothetical protein